jgi:acetyl esterase/lipase
MTSMETSSPRLLSAADLAALPPVVPTHRLTYGSAPEQFGELYLPPQPGRHPVVILLHGGCWQAQYGLGHLGQLSAAFCNAGLAVWNLEYRRLGNGGGWPTIFADVAAGADYLRSVADRFALDLARVITVGHSAGGHLALWLAARPRLPITSPLFAAAPLPVHGVLSLAGIPDLAAAVQRDICSGACSALLGGLPEEVPERYRQASPLALLPLGVPHWHLLGLLDQVIPVDYLQRFVAVAEEHDEVHLELLPDVGHYELIVPTTLAWNAVRHAAFTLLPRR